MIPQDKLKYWEFFVGTLRFKTPMHIASAEISLETDSALLKTVSGQVYIPGTSIAGALRGRAQERFNEEGLINLVFGYQDENKTSLKSRLFVEDAYAGLQMTSLRDGVAIDRRYSSAKEGAKYDLEITPEGLELPLTIKLEIREGDNDKARMRALVFDLVEDFRKGRIKLGAGKSRGLGSCAFDYTWRRLDFGNPGQVLAYLCKRDINQVPEISIEAKADVQDKRLQKEPDFKELDCSIEMESPGSPFLIKDGGWDDDFDAVFAKCMDENGNPRDYIPGSSIKGVIRAHAERILHTLGADACDIVDAEHGCSARVKEALEEFETENKKKSREKEDERVKTIQTNSCPICRLFGNTHLAGRIWFDDAFFETLPVKKRLDHVAIDRFTGGAMQGKLFNEQPVIRGRTTLHFSIKNATVFDKCLLAFLLRDLIAGFPPMHFGYGKTKGYGRLKFLKASINHQSIQKIEDLKQALDIESTEDWWKEGQVHG